MANFNLDAILRGAQLTFVGAHRALQNPGLFTSEHYRQAALAVLAGIVIRFIIAIPIWGVHAILWVLSFVFDLQSSHWDEQIIDGLTFIEHSVLQVPFFLMTLMRYITPTMDQIFMDSLNWVDRTYVVKHRSDDPKHLRAMYYPNLSQYPLRGATRTARDPNEQKKGYLEVAKRYGRKAAISLGIYLLSHIPYVGRFVLPAVSFYTFRQTVGLEPAVIIFGTGVFLPRRYLVVFLQSYFTSRNLMRELLEPYFARIHFDKEQKKRWFKDREAVLFGFGFGFFSLIKIPLVGVLAYGIAEASTAYLVTKITDPPPPPAEAQEFLRDHVRWANKHDFLSLPFANLDKINIQGDEQAQRPLQADLPGKKFS